MRGTDLPPKLEEFLPKEFYPDVLLVHDADDCAFGDTLLPNGSVEEDQPSPPKRHRADTSKAHRYKRVFPAHEAKIFDILSSEKYRHMQQEWCGLNVIRGLLNPVPVGPVTKASTKDLVQSCSQRTVDSVLTRNN